MSEARAIRQPDPSASSGRLTLRLRALRAFSLPLSVLPVPVATAAAVPAGRWDWPVLIAATIGAALMHLTGNLLNDYFDHRRGVDRRVEADDGRPGRLLVRGLLRPRDVLAEAVGCALLTIPPAAFLAWRVGTPVLWFALAGGVGMYVYTGPPFHLKYRALGEVNIFLVFGPLLMLGAAFAQTGSVEWGLLPLAVVAGCMTTAVLVGNNLRDAEEDRTGRIRTLAHVIGPAGQRGLYVALTVGAVLALTAMGAATPGRRILLATPLTLPLLAGSLRAVAAGRRVPDIDARTARFAAAAMALILLACTSRL